jgi:endonuclease-3
MPSTEQVQTVIKELAKLYPDARYDLDFTTPLELFIATQLAAQCTDERVNAVTKDLFKKYRSAQDYVSAEQTELAADIQKITFNNKKAKQLQASCAYLIEHYNGEVPQTMAEMVKIPGIGRKTANVILGNAFGIVEGIIVDTHVDRLAHLLGWTEQKDIVKIEQDLMRIIPREEWLPLAHRLIYHGRAICPARKPHCAKCSLAPVCPSANLENE